MLLAGTVFTDSRDAACCSPTPFSLTTRWSSDGTFNTPAVPNLVGFCANSGGPATVLLGPLSPGSHDLELRYAACDCGSNPPDEATFSNRRLWVRPAP